jgi:hypothetical protein
MLAIAFLLMLHAMASATQSYFSLNQRMVCDIAISFRQV